MAEQRKCAECDSPVPGDAPFGHCPTCLLRLGATPPPPPMPEAQPGRGKSGRPHLLGDFELIAELGCGAMGLVYKARQVSLDRLVALKMISPNVFKSEELVDRFLQEARLAGSLQHPNIVSIYSVGDFEDQPYIAMELIQGTRLDLHITKQGFVWNQAVPEEKRRDRDLHVDSARLITKVARAVHHAHQHGVLHRDIKPGNILLDAAGEPHLTDFGLAKLLGPGAIRRTADGAIMGTPCYMPPEQASGENELVSTAADVYSLGAVLYEMVTGHPPFRGKTQVDTIYKVVNEPLKQPTSLNGSIDPDLQTICMTCLDKDPKRRYDSAGKLADDLEHWLRKEPIDARPVGPAGRAWRWCQREPTLAALTGGVFLLLLTVLIVTYALYRDAIKREEEEQIAVRKAIAILVNQMIEEWERPETDFIKLSPERVDAMLKRKTSYNIAYGVARPLVLGIRASYLKRDPQRILEGYSALLDYLRTNRLALPRSLSLTIYKSYSNLVAAARNGDVHLVRISPASYVQARRQDPGLIPLVQEELAFTNTMLSAIFANTSADIRGWTNMQDMTLVVPERDFLPDDVPAKAFLADQGLHATKFARIARLLRGEDLYNEVKTNASVIGVAEQGAVHNSLRAWKRLGSVPFALLVTNLSTPTFPWVAGSHLDPNVVQALKRSLCALTNSEILTSLFGSPTGFRATRPEDYDAFEEQLRKAQLFDSAPP